MRKIADSFSCVYHNIQHRNEQQRHQLRCDESHNQTCFGAAVMLGKCENDDAKNEMTADEINSSLCHAYSRIIVDFFSAWQQKLIIYKVE
jgi:hypothetical protein